jgi:hypothetical protein
MKLYNMETQEWRQAGFKRGDSWRSSIIYKCNICLVPTNKWIMGGYPGMGPRILCPGDLYTEHDEIEEALKEFEKLDSQIGEFESMLESPVVPQGRKIDKALASKGLESLEGLRELFQALSDVEGLEDDAEVRLYTPSSRYLQKKNLR